MERYRLKNLLNGTCIYMVNKLCDLRLWITYSWSCSWYSHELVQSHSHLLAQSYSHLLIQSYSHACTKLFSFAHTKLFSCARIKLFSCACTKLFSFAHTKNHTRHNFRELYHTHDTCQCQCQSTNAKAVRFAFTERLDDGRAYTIYPLFQSTTVGIATLCPPSQRLLDIRFHKRQRELRLCPPYRTSARLP